MVESDSTGEARSSFTDQGSADETAKQTGFWDAYLAFCQVRNQQALDIEPAEIFANVRDQSPPREVVW